MEKLLDKDKCTEWYNNKSINPITKRKININGRLYKDIKRICDKYKNLSKSDNISSDEEKNSFDKKVTQNLTLSNEDNEDINYPDISDMNFRDKLNRFEEISVLNNPKPSTIKDLEHFESMISRECSNNKNYDKAVFQYFVQHYMSLRTPYKSLLLYYSVGTGKTCAAVSVAEAMLAMQKLTDEPSVYVILPPSIKSTFMKTILDNNCVDSVYGILKNDNLKSKKILLKRYNILSYGEFAKMNPKLDNKTVIVDEAHNLRNKERDDDMDDKDNKAYEILMSRLLEGKNNRLLLMSATPMYNEPNEIVDLFNLMLVNEKRKTVSYESLSNENLEYLSSRYISYINSNNPFIFAQKFKPVEAREVTTSIPYGYIPINLSKEQVNIHKKMKKEDIYLQGFSISNVSSSILSVFNKESKYSYKDDSNPLLLPEKQYLGKYSPKIMKICEKVRESKGVVLIYSRFLMDGIIPLALALEHMGYSRHQGDNLLEYKGLKRNKKLNYVILTSSNVNYIGNMTSFDKMLGEINSPLNKDGDIVKVILITKKASEGLSFLNVREIHILDPWFHISRIEQIVGRGIRRCSHLNLPLNERNVLIYIYIGMIEGIETADYHAIKIAEKKLEEIKRINKIIQKSAIDCVLNKYINNVPREIFENINPVKMITSQGEEILYMYGNDSMVNCDVKELEKISINLREDTMRMTEAIKSKIVRIMKDNRWLSLNELKERCKIYEGDDRYFYYAVQMSVFPNMSMKDGTILYYGNNGVYKVDSDRKKIMEIRINEKKVEKVINNEIEKQLLGLLSIEDEFKLLYYMYETLSEENWHTIAKEIINRKDVFRRLYDILVKHGGIIDNYYVDIFNEEYNILDVTGKDVEAGIRKKIIKEFKSLDITTGSYGSLIPLKGKIQFKIHENNNRGAVCLSKQREDIARRVNGEIKDSENRKQLCIRIAKQFYDEGRLLIVPNLYPDSKK